MPVYLVEVTAGNGNRCSRPVVAETAEDAKAFFAAEHDMDEHDPQLTWEVTLRHDPDGSYERNLLDGERRRLEHEYFARPAKRRARR